MDRELLRSEILAVPVWDTHTHLVPDSPAAQSFWDIGHYFWFLRELQAAGYPQRPEALPEAKRINAYLDAFQSTRNTSMNWVVRHIARDLYDLDVNDVRAVDAAVKQSAACPGWVRTVIDRLAIRRICIHDRKVTAFAHTPGVAYTVPIDANFRWSELVARIQSASDPCMEAERVANEISRSVSAFAAAGVKCIRAPSAPFDRLGAAACEKGDGDHLTKSDPCDTDIAIFLGHALFRALAQHDT